MCQKCRDKTSFLSFNRDFTLNLDLEGQKTLFATGMSIRRVPKRAQKDHIFCLSVCLSVGEENSFRRKTFFVIFRENIRENALNFGKNDKKSGDKKSGDKKSGDKKSGDKKSGD